MSNNPFSGARLKVQRARHHIDDLNSQSKRFLRKNRKVIIRDNVEPGKRAAIIVGDKPFPDCFGLIIGDIIHNLRGALDHAIWELVSPYKPKDKNAVQYPFVKEPNRLVAEIERRQINLAGPEVVKVVTDSRPYDGGDQDLVGLHRLNNTDKHRLILTTEQIMRYERMNLRDIDPSAPSINFSDGIMLAGKLAWPMPPAMNREQRRARGIPADGTELNATLDIVFGQGQPLDGKRVISTLGEIATKVDDIVNRLEQALKKQNSGTP